MELKFKLPHPEPPMKKGGPWTLLEDWEVSFSKDGITEYKIVIEAGFKTDGASIPRWLWPLCGHPLETPRLYAAIVHDYIYSGRLKAKGLTIKRSQADALYREMLIALGISRIVAYTEWLAVRLCGKSHWHK